MVDMYKDIVDFHQKFGLVYEGPARDLPQELWDFRLAFIEEELREYLRGWQDKSLEKQFDALLDMAYVILGTAYLHGFNWNEGWRRVHEANMSKIRAKGPDDSERKEWQFDVVKPDGWEPPMLKDLLKQLQTKDGRFISIGE